MVALLVVLTFVVLVSLDYYVFSRRRQESRAARGPVRAPPPVTAVFEALPSDTYVQPTFTWSRTGPAGTLHLGLHPMLLGLVGPDAVVEALVHDRVERGRPLASIGHGSRRLTVLSPVSGRIQAFNSIAPGANPACDWICRVAPDEPRFAPGFWLTGAAATDWTRRAYNDLRSLLLDAVADRHLGVVMADGGELPIGIMRDLDDAVWHRVQSRLEAASGIATAPEARP